MASLARACSAGTQHPPLRMLHEEDFASARNIVLLIIDGLGDNFLRKRAKGGELERRRRGALTSVFPSTTASAITTSYTGRTPLEHGVTGWFTFFSRAGCVAAALPFRRPGR